MAATATTIRRTKKVPKSLPAPEHTVTHAALVEYLVASAVTELVIVEYNQRLYGVEAQLTWRPGRSVLVATRGDRAFRKLDTAARLLRTLEIGTGQVRLELRS